MLNRCDDCGRFIALSDFESGYAIRRLIYPDSQFTCETWDTLCVDHSGITGSGRNDPTHELLIVIEREKPQSLTEFASGAGWYSPHGKPDKTKAYRAMIKLIAKKLVAVPRKYGNGNDRRYRLTKGGHAALDRHIFKQSF
jgi:hypothetical protein